MALQRRDGAMDLDERFVGTRCPRSVRQSRSSVVKQCAGRSPTSQWHGRMGQAHLWLFGGLGIDSTGNGGNLNDLWKFDPTSDLWTWVGGSNMAGASGVYGSRGIPAPTNVPSARNSAATWVDATGNLWLFGGYGISTGAGAAADYLNDLWEYNPASGQWAWVSGSNSYGVFAPVEYGTLGVAARRQCAWLPERWVLLDRR